MLVVWLGTYREKLPSPCWILFRTSTFRAFQNRCYKNWPSKCHRQAPTSWCKEFIDKLCVLPCGNEFSQASRAELSLGGANWGNHHRPRTLGGPMDSAVWALRAPPLCVAAAHHWPCTLAARRSPSYTPNPCWMLTTNPLPPWLLATHHFPPHKPHTGWYAWAPHIPRGSSAQGALSIAENFISMVPDLINGCAICFAFPLVLISTAAILISPPNASNFAHASHPGQA